MGRRRKHLDIQGGSKIYDDVSVTLSSQKPGKENPAFEMDTVDRLQAAALSRTEPYSSGFSQSLNGSRVNKAFIPDDISSSSSNQVSRRVEGGRIATISGPGLDEANLPPVTFDHELDHVSTQGSEEKVGLKRTMTLLNCSAILISVTGHVAIFVSPANVAKNAGSVGACLVVWLIGGLINMGQALCFTEMGTLLPVAGGPYAFLEHTFGAFSGFFILWGYVVLVAGPFWAFLPNLASIYILAPVFPDCTTSQLETGINLLAGSILLLVVALNCAYVKYVQRVQTLLSASKIIALGIVIGAGIYQLASGDTDAINRMNNMFEGTSSDPGEVALALFYTVFSYGGWQIVTSLLEEVKNPGRDLPRAVYIGFLVNISEFVLANVAYFAFITPNEMADTTAVALVTMNKLSKPLGIVVAVLVATSAMGALNASVMGHTRLLFAGARNGHMPVILCMVHEKYRTPWPAIFTLTGLAFIMLYSGGVTEMMEYIGLFSTVMGVLVCISLLYLRVKQPDSHRSYKTMTIVPVASLIMSAAVLVLALYQKPAKMGMAFGIMFISIPVYWVGVLWKNKPREIMDVVEYLTISAQKLFKLIRTQ